MYFVWVTLNDDLIIKNKKIAASPFPNGINLSTTYMAPYY